MKIRTVRNLLKFDSDNGFTLLLLYSKKKITKEVRLMEAERLHDDFDRSYEVNVNLYFTPFVFSS